METNHSKCTGIFENAQLPDETAFHFKKRPFSINNNIKCYPLTTTCWIFREKAISGPFSVCAVIWTHEPEVARRISVNVI